MKKIKVFLLFLIICVTLTGCSSFRLDSIDDLITPVTPGGDDALILKAVNDYCKSGYSVKIPMSGKYTTSFIRYDLTGSGNEEAVAFYEPSNRLGTIEMAVLVKKNEQWIVADSVAGDGTDVNSVDFCDLDNDGLVEIIVCWSMISGSTSSNLCIYKQNKNENGLSVEAADDSVKADNFVCADINGDSFNDLLVFTVSDPKAELYSFSGSGIELIGETKLDSTINSFSSIICSRTDEGVSVFADALCTNGSSMVTELIYWSDYYDSVISPFYSYSTGRTKDTFRNNTAVSRDIDGDGEIEIPIDKSVSSMPEEITAQDWVSYKNTVLNHKAYSVACEKDGYILVLDDKLFSRLKFSYDSEKRELTAKDDKQEAFRILTVIKSSYDSGKYDNYTEIYSDSGFVYLAKQNAGSKLSITADDLKNSIKTY